MSGLAKSKYANVASTKEASSSSVSGSTSISTTSTATPTAETAAPPAATKKSTHSPSKSTTQFLRLTPEDVPCYFVSQARSPGTGLMASRFANMRMEETAQSLGITDASEATSATAAQPIKEGTDNKAMQFTDPYPDDEPAPVSSSCWLPEPDGVSDFVLYDDRSTMASRKWSRPASPNSFNKATPPSATTTQDATPSSEPTSSTTSHDGETESPEAPSQASTSAQSALVLTKNEDNEL